MNLGIIARADKTGLGNQTRNLVKMLQPFRVMVIDSRPFNKNEQFFETYANNNTQIVRGFPTDTDIRRFLRGLDAVLTCETFYNPKFVDWAELAHIRTYNQYNYEFLDHFINPRLKLPTKLLSPSKWHLDDMKHIYGDRVIYLPPPTFSAQYEQVREYNYGITCKPRFLHIVGRMAMNDRNGTLDLLKALAYTKEDFELVLKVQTSSPVIEAARDDPRVTIDYNSPNDETELYKGFHAMILPRRYAGLCLPMNESLMSGLPVIMTDIDPNNQVLPQKWLAYAIREGDFKTRTQIDLFSAEPQQLAMRMDEMARVANDPTKMKQARDEAYDIAYKNYSAEALLHQYLGVLK